MRRDIPAEMKVGAEWAPVKMLALRLGAEQKSTGGSDSIINGSGGIGLDLGLLGIDSAYYYDSQLTANSRHFVSISLRTPAAAAAAPAEPVV